MSETPKKIDLSAALRDWPTIEKSESEREEMARVIETRLRSGEPFAGGSGLSDEQLLSNPLGQIQGEGHNSAAALSREATARDGALFPDLPSKEITREAKPMTMSDRERDRRSLQDLAKLAQSSNLGMTSPPSSRATSGVQRSAPTLEAKPDSQPKTDDSGIVDLAAAQVADPEAETRAKSTAPAGPV